MLKKIGVLTYNVKHRKTYDTLCLLKARGYKNVSVYAIPQHYTKCFYPLIEHRPSVFAGMPETKTICKNFQYNYIEGKLEDLMVPNDEIILICGAGILKEEFINSHIIINSHPGYIPESRGLDALKWAIYEKKKIGVSTHFLGDYIDAGVVIERKLFDVGKYDTFHSIAQKVYENEISMLVDAIEKIEEEHILIEPNNSIVHKRMPNTIEQDLFSCFEALK